MHTTWSVTYRVADAKKYYLAFYEGAATRDAEGTVGDTDLRAAEIIVRSCLEGAVLQEVATWRVDDVRVLSRALAGASAGGERVRLSDAVRTRLEGLIGKLDLGVEIQEVSVTNVQAPAATLAAFREVNDAANEYSKGIEDARAYSERVQFEAEARASEIVADAQAYRTRVVASVEADRGYFLKVLEEYRKNPETMLVALYSDTIRDVLNQVKSRYIVHARADGRQEVRLLLGPEPQGSEANPHEIMMNPH